jgi:hypothetical protein
MLLWSRFSTLERKTPLWSTQTHSPLGNLRGLLRTASFTRLVSTPYNAASRKSSSVFCHFSRSLWENFSSPTIERVPLLHIPQVRGITRRSCDPGKVLKDMLRRSIQKSVSSPADGINKTLLERIQPRQSN